MKLLNLEEKMFYAILIASKILILLTSAMKQFMQNDVYALLTIVIEEM